MAILNRREVFFGAGAIIAAPTLASAKGADAPRGSSEEIWRAARKQFSEKLALRFMNVGTTGSLPLAAERAVILEMEKDAAEFIDGYSDFLAERTRIAPSFGCEPQEIAFTTSTSDGMFKAIFGLNWSAGDEVVTTDQEHAGCMTPLRVLAQKFGIVVKKAHLPMGPKVSRQALLDSIASLVTPRTKAIVFSSPTYPTGTVLPVVEIAAMARKAGVVTICDGSHMPGMLPIDFRKLGVDFLAGAGHKWQCGPLGTGFLLIRNLPQPDWPLPEWEPVSWFGSVPNRNAAPANSVDIGGRVIGLGSRNRMGIAGLAASCDLWDSFGRKAISDHILDNSTRLRTLIAERWGAEALFSPLEDASLYSGMVSFNPFWKKSPYIEMKMAQSICKQVDEESGYHFKEVPIVFDGTGKWGMRIAPHFWHSPEDIQGVVEAVDRVVTKMSV